MESSMESQGFVFDKFAAVFEKKKKTLIVFEVTSDNGIIKIVVNLSDPFVS
jgi:hypothetical protein